MLTLSQSHVPFPGLHRVVRLIMAGGKQTVVFAVVNQSNHK
jgi:hypothetical protein